MQDLYNLLPIICIKKIGTSTDLSSSLLKTGKVYFCFKSSIFLLLFTLSAFFSLGQENISFDHFSLDEGFYDGIVTDIYQDRYHFLWIGTADGLYLYDGNQFKEYRKDTDDPHALKSNVITSISEDKNGHLWIGTEGGGLNLFDRQNNRFLQFAHDPNIPTSLSSDFVTSMVTDEKGHLWIGAEEGALNVLQFDSLKNKFYFRHFDHHPLHSEVLSGNSIAVLFEDSRGRIWIGAEGGGLVCMEYESLDDLRFERSTHQPDSENSIAGNIVNAIHEDQDGCIWAGTSEGLSRLNVSTNTWMTFRHEPGDPNSLSHNFVRSIEPDPSGRLWVGTQKGLNLLDPDKGSIQRFHHHPKDDQSLSNDVIMDIYGDDHGSIWIGCWGGALNRINPFSRQFVHYNHIPGEANALSAPHVTSITEDEEGNLWVATEKGLDRIDLQTDRFSHYQYNRNAPSTKAFNDIIRVFGDRKENIWIATTEGAYRFNPSTNKIRTFIHDPEDPGSIPKGQVWDIIEDSYGLIWMGVYRGGLVCWNPETEKMTGYRHNPLDSNSIGEDRVMEIYEDSRKNLWVGTYEGGLTHVIRDERGRPKKFERFVEDSKKPSSISSNVVWSILETENGNIWVGTANGLNRMDRASGAFKSFKERDGLPNNFVFGLLPSVGGRIWVSTNRGLSLFDPVAESFQNFDARDGLEQNEFNKGAYWKGRNGARLFFGGVNGLNVLNNRTFKRNTHLPPVVISKMLVFNQKNDKVKGRECYGVAYQNKIELPYYENTLEFEFAALDFINPPKNEYAYRLVGLSERWINLGASNTIRFGGLSPGRYSLEVKASNNNGLWNEEPTVLDITIRSPWWATSLAKFLYILMAGGSLYYIYRFFLGKRLAEEESERLRKQDAFKTRLYTDITHEFRTPLTVISGMSDQIKGNKKAKKMIKRNTQDLLNLVNQILELRKMEMGEFSFHNIQGDIVSFLGYCVEPFYDYAQQKDISLELQSEEEEIWMDFDPQVIQRVFSNLMSNAIKYNKKGGEVKVNLSRHNGQESPVMRLEIQDTGMGIEKDELQNIFRRFYQLQQEGANMENGIGVGLDLVREYVHLLNGKIEVQSTPGLGSTFCVLLPITKMAEREENPKFVKAQSGAFHHETELNISQKGIHPKKENILVVEDSPDVAQYLKICLEKKYNIQIAENGATGVEMAMKNVPDLIVSDVMMPGKDGYEMTETLKRDIRTSHIPIILLTARADVPSKLKGLETGADAYLSKPFNQQELLLRISNLLEMRKKLQQRYQAEVIPPSSGKLETKNEDLFIKKVQEIIKNHLDDPDFGIKELCKEIGMSRTQLHNKIKAVTGRSTSLYIRLVRLREGKRLLEETEQTVSEIAYTVGFKDPNYFSKTFNLEYGTSPSRFRK